MNGSVKNNQKSLTVWFRNGPSFEKGPGRLESSWASTRSQINEISNFWKTSVFQPKPKRTKRKKWGPEKAWAIWVDETRNTRMERTGLNRNYIDCYNVSRIVIVNSLMSYRALWWQFLLIYNHKASWSSIIGQALVLVVYVLISVSNFLSMNDKFRST